MPKQKDLKRLVRARMQKTGESYTAARLRVVARREPAADLAKSAGMSDASVRKATGRTWREWTRVLDAAGSASKPHREIARHLASLGLPSWWSQMVTVGYERIRGLRDRGQRRGGGYTATKSRTFAVPLRTLFEAFVDPAARGRWLSTKVAVRSATPNRRVRLVWDDGTVVLAGFVSKGTAKSTVAIEHQGLSGRPAADAMKEAWSEAFDRLSDWFS
jgi:uncharacterized protein YndB with AHSA1/START domain